QMKAQQIPDDLAAKGSAIVGQHCKSDGWSQALIDCGATSKDAKADCDKLITDDQRKKLDPDMSAAMAGAMAASGSGSGSSDPLAELATIKDHACACKDADCANKVQEEFEAWAKTYADVKGSADEADRAGKLAESISECMVSAMSGSGG